ncbi:hypothetical protein LX77_02132 [Gelidibacter algens]|uniref:GDSL-like lipase/acylhydrolase family protein n=1 Tax=Gelidibacter algens TaxID=49280 RepID=A0A1A7QQA1_9FLAO|nr:G-D-S-L family lipolytic protein [Gelidibacter algens]OBX21394.1 G-D-S-L family lipolytic protein [Gelidibacter algens]RAJ22973.1 hypothetical protein LX77_02132 [Gelidibacter algens]
MKNIKYLLLSSILVVFTACSEDEYDYNPTPEPLPELTAGSADFTTYVSVGNSLTSGFTDNALFIAGQKSSFPNILAQKFALVGGGDFTLPLMNDNVGGFLFGGNANPSFGPRLYLDLTTTPRPTPTPLPAMSTTEVFGPTLGPKNNMGIPGAKSYHLLFDGYGNPINLATATANPYFIRMASTPSATVLGDAMSQSPTFFSLWIGNNDVLGYALTGGDGTNPITPLDGPQGVGFAQTYGAIVATLTSAGAQGVVANIPSVTTIPHFTTVPYNPVPLDAATATALNQGYAQYNGGLQLALNALNGTGLFTAAEVAKRTINFSAGPANALVIIDETLTDLGAINPAFAGIPKYRQATEDDLFVLPLSSLIPQGYGTQIPLADKWVLLPSEQAEIATATTAFNNVISTTASQAGLAFVDANALLNQLSNGGVSTGDFILRSNLVQGGAFGLDGVHPTSRGYALIANMFMRAIDTTYGSNFEASGNFADAGNYPTNYGKEFR